MLSKAEANEQAKELVETAQVIEVSGVAVRRMVEERTGELTADQHYFEIVNTETAKKLVLTDDQFWQLQQVMNAMDSSFPEA